MQYKQLGRSGLVVSRLCVGSASFGGCAEQTWRTDCKTAEAIVRKALEKGINFFDTGPTYGAGEAEAILGAALRATASRDEYVIATKVFFATGPGPNDRGLSRRHILASVEASLKRLRLEHVDLLLMHRWDPHTPIEETLQTFELLIRSGKVRYLGASSMSAWRFMKALATQRALGYSPFISMQNYYNLIYREEEREMVPLCLEEGVGMTPWSPLARGLLAGPAGDAARLAGDSLAMARFLPELDTPVIEQLNAVAAERGEPPAKIALAWLLGSPGVVSPILGFSDTSQIDLACEALNLMLSADERARLEAPYEPHPVIGFELEQERA
ncbi:MAG TPA: aldo/keto reductase [Steroidobacteraceae bacterium]|jgi:aryl-alcohol dehydrogenase-like predicted oxidoreductase|nr:aldo/keto reductase [Steroidobacteraceae bacterium]